MKVFLATDHAGFELKEKVKAFLKKEGYEVEDCGAHEFDKNDDYPDFISKAAKAVSKDPENSRGIIFAYEKMGMLPDAYAEAARTAVLEMKKDLEG